MVYYFFFAKEFYFILSSTHHNLTKETSMNMAPSYCLITGNEVQEDLEATKIFENALKDQRSPLSFPGRLFSSERAEKCYQLAMESLLKDSQPKISIFLSQKFITFKIGAQDEASLLNTLPKEIITVIVLININLLLPSFKDFKNKFIPADDEKILTTNDFILSLMNGPLPKITYS